MPFLSARAVAHLVKSPFRGLFHRSAVGNRLGTRPGGVSPDARGWRAGRTRGVVVVGHGTADPVGAEETRQTNLRVNLLSPGAIRTKMRAEAFPGERPDSLPPPDAITEAFVALAEPACTRHGETVTAR